MSIQLLALYQFKNVIDPKSLQKKLLQHAPQDVLGTLILANEGINGTIAGSVQSMQVMLNLLHSAGFNDMEYKFSTADHMPFLRFKVICKPEIVTLGEDVDPCSLIGKYVDVQEWNALISEPDVLLIDTRNDYEYQLGTFKGAINSKTMCFRAFPDFVKGLKKKHYQRVAMFCTGGIRCEKASAYMLQIGFKEVFHLKGGILKYLENISEDQSMWEGSCFVFDRRVALGHGLKITGHQLCYVCRSILSLKEQQHPHYFEGISCENCYGKLPSKKIMDLAERQKQISKMGEGESHFATQNA
jgi:UPF0176 protein